MYIHELNMVSVQGQPEDLNQNNPGVCISLSFGVLICVTHLTFLFFIQ